MTAQGKRVRARCIYTASECKPGDFLRRDSWHDIKTARVVPDVYCEKRALVHNINILPHTHCPATANTIRRGVPQYVLLSLQTLYRSFLRRRHQADSEVRHGEYSPLT